jgi:hypothetical protein
MLKDSWQEFFCSGSGSDQAALQVEIIKASLRPELTALNQAVANKDKVATVDCVARLSLIFEQLRPLAVSSEVCNSVVGVLQNIAKALAGRTKTDVMVQSVLAVENWQKENRAKVILDFEAFKKLAFS